MVRRIFRRIIGIGLGIGITHTHTHKHTNTLNPTHARTAGGRCLGAFYFYGFYRWAFYCASLSTPVFFRSEAPSRPHPLFVRKSIFFAGGHQVKRSFYRVSRLPRPVLAGGIESRCVQRRRTAKRGRRLLRVLVFETTTPNPGTPGTSDVLLFDSQA